MNRRSLAFLTAFALLSIGIAATRVRSADVSPASHARIAPMLLSLAAMSAADRSAMAGTFGVASSGSGSELAVIIDYTGDLGSLKALGVKVRTQLGGIITADIPADSVNLIASLPGVEYIQPAKQFYPMLDQSVPDTHATNVRSGVPPNWTGYTGKGVVIGMVDTGVDVNHQDLRDAEGNSRILFIWDQTTGAGGANHPSTYTYGTEWTKAEIDAGQCTERDTNGHGTSVITTAAGDGSATGNGWPAYRYAGMAPEADIIVVKGTFMDDTIIDGMNYIRNKASALGKPCVINLSIGTQMSAHDGTAAIERAIDQISGQGVVVCTASGNSGTTDPARYVHAQWSTPSNNSEVTAGINVTPTRAGVVYMDLWYQGRDSIDITVTTPNGYSVTKSTGSTTGGYSSTPDGGIQIENAPGTNPHNDDNECVIFLQNALSGAWSLTATGKTIREGGTCDAWLESGHNVFWSTYGTNTMSCTIPGTSNAVITTGGYQTRSWWTNPDGTVQGWSSPFGSFHSLSGEGPTRDGRQKPDLCSPSSRIVSGRSANSNPTPTNIAEDGVHVVLSGTSVAVPHLSGAAALLLQRDPTATAAEIKSYLMSTARSDSFTGPVPNTKWGVGKLDVQAAMNITSMYTEIPTARLEADGTPVKLPSQVVTAGLNQFLDRFYIESADRSAGIQVRTGTGTGIQAAEGSKVTVKGILGVADGERAVLSPIVTPAGTGTTTRPLGMAGRAIGGGMLGSYVPGVTDATGLNNVGLLVTVSGKVTYVGSDHFYIDDGTGLAYTPGRTGLKVFCGSLSKPVFNHSVVITGISTLSWDGSTARPVVRARKQSDLTYY